MYFVVEDGYLRTFSATMLEETLVLTLAVGEGKKVTTALISMATFSLSVANQGCFTHITNIEIMDTYTQWPI